MRAHETELKAALDEHKQAAEKERLHWKEELRHLRELLERRVEANKAEERFASPTEPAAPTAAPPANPTTTKKVTSRENPVLGSIVQQFDKLRQQRASDRNSGTKPR